MQLTYAAEFGVEFYDILGGGGSMKASVGSSSLDGTKNARKQEGGIKITSSCAPKGDNKLVS